MGVMAGVMDQYILYYNVEDPDRAGCRRARWLPVEMAASLSRVHRSQLPVALSLRTENTLNH